MWRHMVRHTHLRNIEARLYIPFRTCYTRNQIHHIHPLLFRHRLRQCQQWLRKHPDAPSCRSVGMQRICKFQISVPPPTSSALAAHRSCADCDAVGMPSTGNGPARQALSCNAGISRAPCTTPLFLLNIAACVGVDSRGAGMRRRQCGRMPCVCPCGLRWSCCPPCRQHVAAPLCPRPAQHDAEPRCQRDWLQQATFSVKPCHHGICSRWLMIPHAKITVPVQNSARRESPTYDQNTARCHCFQAWSW